MLLTKNGVDKDSGILVFDDNGRFQNAGYHYVDVDGCIRWDSKFVSSVDDIPHDATFEEGLELAAKAGWLPRGSAK